MPITSPVDFISGPRMTSTSGEASEGEDRLLHRHVADLDRRAARSSSRSVLPTMHSAAIFASGTPVALEMKGTVRDARGFTSRT